MKKVLFLLLFASSFIHAQYTVKGTINPAEKYNWVLLYKVEGARQIFIKNTQIAKQDKEGTFQFELPADAKMGSYRITYDLQRNGFVDFLFNKENIEVSFNPLDTQRTTSFQKSKENQLYKEFLNKISIAQYKVDSLQIAYLKAPSMAGEEAYKKSVSAIRVLQKEYNKNSQGTLAHDFIKATDRYNSPQPAKNSQEYLDGVIGHFFDKIDFSNSNLYNSSFLIDRIADYVFYMHYSQDADTQEKLYKKAVDGAINKVQDIVFKADVIEFLISQFSLTKNTPLVNYLFTNYFDKLPKENQNLEFKKKTMETMAIAIGNVAPNFSWEENGRMMSLSDLKDGQNYLIIFYSTGCSHCLREVPQVYDFLKGKPKTKVIAFAMETEDTTWLNYQKNLLGWHHVLGLDKWENKIARTYQINSTPTYFVLGSDKTIIANPEKLEDLKMILTKLN